MRIPSSERVCASRAVTRGRGDWLTRPADSAAPNAQAQRAIGRVSTTSTPPGAEVSAARAEPP
jgi:hypothetical protein